MDDNFSENGEINKHIFLVTCRVDVFEIFYFILWHDKNFQLIETINENGFK